MKKLLLWLISLATFGFILFGSLLYFLFLNTEKQDIKNHFEFISSLSFPIEGKIIESDCMGVGWEKSGYSCNGKFTVSKETYQKFKAIVASSKTSTFYQKDSIEWNWGLIDDNQTVYFTYTDHYLSQSLELWNESRYNLFGFEQ